MILIERKPNILFIMKRNLIYIFTSLILYAVIVIINTTLICGSNEAIDIVYYYDNPCGGCDEEGVFLELLREKTKNDIKGIQLNISMNNTFPTAPDSLDEFFESYNVPDDERVTPIVFIGDTYISGQTQIHAKIGEVFKIEKDKFISNYDKKETIIIYFYVEPCPSCEEISLYFETLSKGYIIEYNGEIIYSDLTIKKFNISDKYSLDILRAYFKEYEVLSEDQKVPIVFIGGKYLSGEDPIIKSLEEMIESGDGLYFRIIDIDELDLENDKNNNNDIANDVIYLIYSEYCEVCKKANDFLTKLVNGKEITIIGYDVNNDIEEVEYLVDKYEIKNLTVPIIIYKDKLWQGFNFVVEREITNLIDDELNGDSSNFLFWNLNEIPIILVTVIIGFVDGFNPCSIWALLFLISMIIRFKSRKLIITIGVTYVVVISLIYGFFIIGLFAIITYIFEYFSVRLFIFFVAFTFGIVNILSFISPDRKMYFSISNKNKKRFIERIRNKLYKNESLFGFILSAIIIAVFASLIELPCTAGFPIVWNGIVSESVSSMFIYISLLMLYLLMYVLVEIAIVIFLAISMSKLNIDIVWGRSLKLISGSLMTYLAIIFLLGSTYLNDIKYVLGGSLLVLALSISLSVIILNKNKKIV